MKDQGATTSRCRLLSGDHLNPPRWSFRLLRINTDVITRWWRCQALVDALRVLYGDFVVILFRQIAAQVRTSDVVLGVGSPIGKRHDVVERR